MSLDVDDGRPPYLQVAEAIRRDIQAGRLNPGDQLASVVELATRYGVAKMTVQRAIGLLRDEQLVVSWQGRGTYVRDPEAAPPPANGPNGYATVMKRLDDVMTEVERLEARVAALEHGGAEGSPGRRRGPSAG